MGRLLSVDADRREARVQPGIVCAELERDLEPLGLMFAPDPSSGDVCRLGGMIANNSAGPRTVKYGAVKDNVSSLRVVLHHGAAIEARSFALDEPEFRRLLAERPEIRTAFEPLRRYKLADTATWTQPSYSGSRVFVKDVSNLALWSLN